MPTVSDSTDTKSTNTVCVIRNNIVLTSVRIFMFLDIFIECIQYLTGVTNENDTYNIKQNSKEKVFFAYLIFFRVYLVD